MASALLRRLGPRAKGLPECVLGIALGCCSGCGVDTTSSTSSSSSSPSMADEGAESGMATESDPQISVSDPGVETPSVAPPCDLDDIEIGPRVLRRLTTTQYQNTLRDLFPGVVFPRYDFAKIGHEDRLASEVEGQIGSALWMYQAHANAVDAAARIWRAGDDRLGCSADGGDDPSGCLLDYVDDLAPLALRRPLTAEQADAWQGFVARAHAQWGFSAALELFVQALLQDLGFLYLLPDPAGDSAAHGRVVPEGPYALASRLSYFIWDSMPDAELLSHAAAGTLATREHIRTQARRMIADPRTRDMLLDLHGQIFAFDRIDALVAKPGELPDLTDELRASMREEMERMVVEVLFDEGGRFIDLFTHAQTWVDAPLATIYGLDFDDSGPAWQPRGLDPDQRSGILTTPGFLAAHTVGTLTSPVRRGVFVLSRLTCRPPPPPPADVDTSIPPEDLSEHQSTRERFAAHSSRPECAGCHASIDGVGFGFESLDALGRHRSEDNFRPVDDSGRIQLDGRLHEFAGAAELSQILAQSPTVAQCGSSWWIRQAMGRALTEQEACVQARIETLASDDRHSALDLAVEIVSSPVFTHYRHIDEPDVAFAEARP